MSELDRFSDIFDRRLGGVRQAQLRFAICKSVDWSDKSMTATGVNDDVDYEGVQLGFGYIDIKPKKDTVCLIGILEGKEALTFLINAEEVELVEVNVESEIKINGGNNGGLVLSEKVKSEIDTVIQRVNDIVTALTNIATSATATAQAPVLGAALGSLITGNISNIILPLNKPAKTVFENDKITH
jgi:hypothetical protein